MENYVVTFFDEKGRFHIAPRDNFAAMGLKYLEAEREEHGEMMIVIDTEVPAKLPSPDANY